MENKIVEIKNLNFNINEHKILRNVNLDIYKGEFIGLIGPNGAGKTTLLKSLNGINKCSGTIKIDNYNINSMSDKEVALKVALMHQNTSIAFPFPAGEIVMMGRYPHLKRMQSISKADRKIAEKYMNFTNTLKFKEKPITQMSGGERQRVLFAKVLTQETDIILLDEPTASLDITYEEQIFKYSKELSQNGKTIIAAVHDLRIAAKYCSRLILLREGEILADGLPDIVLTSKNIKEAYKVDSFVYKNPFTSLIDFYTYEKKNDIKKIHVICGGGTGSDIIHYLFKKGYKISCGIVPYGDVDAVNSKIMKIDTVECEPFSDINHEVISKNIENIKQSDLTILTNISVGKHNMENLMNAKHSKNLIIIEDSSIEERDHTHGKATIIYNELKKNAKVINSKDIKSLCNIFDNDD